MQANKQKVIDALATIDSTKRTYVAIRYKELHNIELSELMKKEFSGDFGLALEFLSLRPDDAEVKMLRRAHQGVGANVNIIWSILLGRTNAEMEMIKKKYFARYTKDLSKVMAAELHGNMERLIFNAVQAGEEAYDPQYHSPDKALEDAEFIYKKGQGAWGTDERSLFKIFCASPKEHLENVSKYVACPDLCGGMIDEIALQML
jgi:Annexin